LNVLPGFIDSLPEKEERRVTTPLQRYGPVEEIAAMVASLPPDWQCILRVALGRRKSFAAQRLQAPHTFLGFLRPSQSMHL
jgi:hypothetical protein